MTPAEHRANAERLMSAASFYTADPAKDHDARSLVAEATLLTAQAQVHATLALAPAPPPEKPQQRMDPAAIHGWIDATGARLACWPNPTGGAFLGNDEVDDAWLIEDPATLRNLASLLTAHADRLESRP